MLPGRGAGLAVGLRALERDRRVVQQIARRLRHERDAAAPRRRRQRRRIRRRRRRPCRSTACRSPASAHSSDDLPDPLRPMHATTSPANRSRSTDRTATTSPYRTEIRRAVRCAVAVVRVSPWPRPLGARGRRAARAATARAGARRAPRAATATTARCRPSSTTGGATSAFASIGSGSPSVTRPSAARCTTRSAYCTTRSSRCSATTTVVPRSCTSRVIAASTSSAAVGSSAEVGSSSTSTRGWVVSTEPIATRCCWPPESARSGRSRSVGQPEEVERLLDALAHHVGRQRELLHPVRELFLDGVGDESGERVLADDADDVGELTRRVRARFATVDEHAAREVAAGEVGDQPVDRAEQRRLADARPADDEHELAFGDREVDVAEHGRVARPDTSR